MSMPHSELEFLDQLNSEFDVQEKLSIAKRTQTIEVKFDKASEPIPVCVFARWSKGKCEIIFFRSKKNVD